ncbi:MAG: acyltransferase domain-containing protein, partial [Rhodospirillales bacterium]
MASLTWRRGNFRVFGVTLANHVQPSMAIAASRAGHTGILDLEFADLSAADTHNALAELARGGRGSWGLKLRASAAPALFASAGPDCSAIGCAIFVLDDVAQLAAAVRALKELSPRAEAFAELHDADLLDAVQAAAVDGIVAKGHEAGGWVGDETCFLLTQRLATATSLPVIAHGGVGMNTAAAYQVAGAAGVLLDWQLALFEEAMAPPALARIIAQMDGSETRCLGSDLDLACRVFWRADHEPAHALERMLNDGCDAPAFLAALDAAVDPAVPESSLWLMGQDAAFAGRLAKQFTSMARALDALQGRSAALIQTARRVRPLAEGSALAQALGTRYPIVQGPMTRVSDRADFAVSVAREGALPFVALALMRREEASALLDEVREKIDGMPWGVGILGFVDDALREEQSAVIAEYKPEFALIAGGQPDQAAALEAKGISTFLHVPSPGLLSLFLESGAKRFIFEGRECGGHVGPRSSAVLWQQAIDGVLDHFGPDDPIDCELLFAGGIHDGCSGAMVSAMAAELAERGARIGALVGTGYILTKEALETGAILETYQKLVLDARKTTLLESGPGHATRVVRSPIVDEFQSEKARLQAERTDPEEIKDRLERFNVGRSRIASKGIDHNPDFGSVEGAKKFMQVGKKDQLRLGVYMIGQAAGLHSKQTTIADLHGAISHGAGDLIDELASSMADAVPGPQVEGPGARIAITGIGALLPKARDLARYWENILDRVDAIEEVPERRWDWRRYFDADRDARDKIYSKWGGFIDEVEFDPIRYGIPPNSMPSIEPLQLLALEVVREALENAGYPDGVIDDPQLRRRTSVIIGVGGGTGPLGQRYAVRASLPAITGEVSELADQRLPDWTEDSFPGILMNVIAGRVANRFDLGGVNFTVDAACGSSLAAVMLAVRELETGTSDMVIVGGADSFQNPFDFVAFSKTRALSPRGKCRTFDADADGIAISEGLVMMVLRPLDQAEANGDRIYAVLRGIAGSSDGRDLSLTAPRPEGQQEALRRAYERAGISPGTVGAVEAHGTGTVVGDRTEIQSLSEVFGSSRTDTQFCGVGSVKSMIGHTKATAGCAGLAKMALALHHRVLPPTLNVEKPNPTANFPQSPFYVMSEARPWFCAGQTPRRAGISAFGFGGTNFHAVLEEYTGGYLPRHQAPFRRDWTHELYLFSAENTVALAEEIRRAASALKQAPEHVAARDVSASLARRFEPGAGSRVALVATSLADAAARLSRAAEVLDDSQNNLREIDPMGAYASSQTPLTRDQVAFLFPGQGSQYPGMAGDLVMMFPELRRDIEAASTQLADRTPAPLADLIYPRPTLDTQEAADQAAALKQTNVAQPAIGAVSHAVLNLLRSFGLDASAMTGHSFGEYTALCAAGAFDAQTLLDLAFARGDAIMATGGMDLGTMSAVNADEAAVRAALGDAKGVTLANFNAPDQIVIAGRTEAIDAADERLVAAGLEITRLPVACGFHSECVAPAQERLVRAIDGAQIGGPDRMVFANATAAPYPDEPSGVREQLARHLVEPVNFLGAISAMHESGVRLFVEVGPNSVLSRLTGRILVDQPHLAVASDVKGRCGAQQLLCLLGAAASAGIALDLERLWAGRARADIDVATWDFARPADPRRALLWKVDAANARPIDGAPERRGFAARIEEDPAPASPQPVVAAQGAPVSAVAAASSTPAEAAAPTRAAGPEPHLPGQLAPPGTGFDAIMHRHQELMAQFLENHSQVMKSWLGAGSAAAVATPVASASPTQVSMTQSLVPTPPAEPATAVPRPATAPPPAAPEAPPAAAPTITAEVVTARLLDLISERTGYPTEMLDAGLDLEADLGVDSIKRVEILGALRTSLLPH